MLAANNSQKIDEVFSVIQKKYKGGGSKLAFEFF